MFLSEYTQVEIRSILSLKKKKKDLYYFTTTNRSIIDKLHEQKAK